LRHLTTRHPELEQHSNHQSILPALLHLVYKSAGGFLQGQVEDGRLDLEALKDLPDEVVHSTLTSLRGWGPWSANYFLVRGLARPDCVPADDLAIRSVVGRYLGDGSRASAGQVAQLLAPFAPYRGMAAFYLEAHERLSR